MARRYATYEPASGTGFNPLVLVPALGVGFFAGALLAGRTASRIADEVSATGVTRARLFGVAGAVLILVGVAALTLQPRRF